MKKFFTLIFILNLLYFNFNPLSKTLAAESNPDPAGVPLMEYMVARVICTTVPLGYIVLMVVLIIAGFKYIVSGGETKAVSSAHQTITWGIMGLLFLAISWLILLLIQNFTGIEVTKFSVSSLPGIQGFTGSCWAAAPKADTNQNYPPVCTQGSDSPTSNGPSSETDYSLGYPVYSFFIQCNINGNPDNPPVGMLNYINNLPPPSFDPSFDYNFPLAVSTLDTTTRFIYTENPFNDPGFALTLTSPKIINVSLGNLGIYTDSSAVANMQRQTFMRDLGNGALSADNKIIRERDLLYSIANYNPTFGRGGGPLYGTGADITGPIDNLFARYPKGKLPLTLIEVLHDSQKSVIAYAKRQIIKYGSEAIINNIYRRRTIYTDHSTVTDFVTGLQNDDQKIIQDLESVWLIGYKCACFNYYQIEANASPIIFLYPQQKLNINVLVDYPGVITPKPKLNDLGEWHVIADKNGLITDKSGQYEFLSYQFMEPKYRKPTQGFIVESSKLEDFLKHDLWVRIGLNEKEINDYWQDISPRLKPANYYFISLVERGEMDKILPIEISPKPDHIFRNFIYIKSLAKPYSVNPLDITSFKIHRDGFIAIENGVFIDAQ